MFNVSPRRYCGDNPYGFSMDWFLKNLLSICSLGGTTIYYCEYCSFHVQIVPNTNFFKEDYWKSALIRFSVEVRLSDIYRFKNDYKSDELIQAIIYFIHKYYHIKEMDKSEHAASMTVTYIFVLGVFNYGL